MFGNCRRTTEIPPGQWQFLNNSKLGTDHYFFRVGGGTIQFSNQKILHRKNCWKKNRAGRVKGEKRESVFYYSSNCYIFDDNSCTSYSPPKKDHTQSEGEESAPENCPTSPHNQLKCLWDQVTCTNLLLCRFERVLRAIWAFAIFWEWDSKHGHCCPQIHLTAGSSRSICWPSLDCKRRTRHL